MDSVREGLLTRCGPAHWLVDASELDLAPGYWPEIIEVVRPDDSRVRLRRAFHLRGSAGEFQGYTYFTARGGSYRLDVVND